MKKLFLTLLLFIFLAIPAQAASVVLQWDNASTDEGGNPIAVESVNVYQSSISGGSYTLVGNVLVTDATGTYTVSGLSTGTYYFVVTSVYQGVVSVDSNEVSETILILPNAPSGLTIITVTIP